MRRNHVASEPADQRQDRCEEQQPTRDAELLVCDLSQQGRYRSSRGLSRRCSHRIFDGDAAACSVDDKGSTPCTIFIVDRDVCPTPAAPTDTLHIVTLHQHKSASRGRSGEIGHDLRVELRSCSEARREARRARPGIERRCVAPRARAASRITARARARAALGARRPSADGRAPLGGRGLAGSAEVDRVDRGPAAGPRSAIAARSRSRRHRRGSRSRRGGRRHAAAIACGSPRAPRRAGGARSAAGSREEGGDAWGEAGHDRDPSPTARSRRARHRGRARHGRPSAARAGAPPLAAVARPRSQARAQLARFVTRRDRHHERDGEQAHGGGVARDRQ